MLDIKNRRIMQIGYVVSGVEKSIKDYSKRLGIGPWDIYTFCAPDLHDAIYSQARLYFLSYSLNIVKNLSFAGCVKNSSCRLNHAF